MVLQKVYRIEFEEKKKIKGELTTFLKEKEDISFAYLHGSFLEGDFRDIDLALYLKKVPHMITRFETKLEIELGKMMGYPVDVRVLNNSPLSYRFKAIKNGELLFSRDESLRAEYEGLTFVEYHDFSPYRKRYLREALNLEI